MDGSATARRAWLHIEPVHDVVYFAPESRAQTDAAGLRGFWMAYFAMRSAPLGAVPTDVVTATFYGFHPARVERALPDAWQRITPEAALALRHEVVDTGLRALLGDNALRSPEWQQAADLAWDAARFCDVAGRPLAAANRALPRPPEAHLALWLATTVLREHRGDGHIAALVAHGVTPAQSHLIKIAADESSADLLRDGRGFPADEWDLARTQLADDGVLDASGRLTRRGTALHESIEQATDASAVTPWQELGPHRTERLMTLLCPWARTLMQSGAIPAANPVGLVFDPDCVHA